MYPTLTTYTIWATCVIRTMHGSCHKLEQVNARVLQLVCWLVHLCQVGYLCEQANARQLGHLPYLCYLHYLSYLHEIYCICVTYHSWSIYTGWAILASRDPYPHEVTYKKGHIQHRPRYLAVRLTLVPLPRLARLSMLSVLRTLDELRRRAKLRELATLSWISNS